MDVTYTCAHHQVSDCVDMVAEPPKGIQTLGRIAGKDYDSGINFEEAMLAFS